MDTISRCSVTETVPSRFNENDTQNDSNLKEIVKKYMQTIAHLNPIKLVLDKRVTFVEQLSKG